ncbi:A/G-specific adenine glycosylase [Ottowia testudinis]|uniref:Adenine DNA glycosylase n=1 Tax=Ottowia testudinis TaxID=2816950 RepID=A0A975CJ73_9BURK|nr:A/G-specific adenine glycosylase [Ottowia testudinis]
MIAWQQRHGRHDLPWQRTRDPYRVWLSEIMLQQTQVASVLAYYPRFLARFPDVTSLAEAEEDEVLGLWSGLGYYSRARNLHRCAREVMARFGGAFPRTAAELVTLPGIGRSTAAAIAAFCFGERAAILDGNVKRVLTRRFGIADDLSEARHERALWQRAEGLLPTTDLARQMPIYTQGLMDLGAGICSQRRPACAICPLVDVCVAARGGEPQRYPVKTRRPARRQLTLWLLHARDERGRVWLVQRPGTGIWARLFCLPLHEGEAALRVSLPAAAQASAVAWPAFRHVLTHRDLDIHIVSARVQAADMSGAVGRWFAADEWPALGLPAPIRAFLQQAC